MSKFYLNHYFDVPKHITSLIIQISQTINMKPLELDIHLMYHGTLLGFCAVLLLLLLSLGWGIGILKVQFVAGRGLGLRFNGYKSNFRVSGLAVSLIRVECHVHSSLLR